MRTSGKGNKFFKPTVSVSIKSTDEFKPSTDEEGNDIADSTNPWKVRDHVWTNGDYDAHLTGTVCRKFVSTEPKYTANELQYMGDDWDNTYDYNFWY